MEKKRMMLVFLVIAVGLFGAYMVLRTNGQTASQRPVQKDATLSGPATKSDASEGNDWLSSLKSDDKPADSGNATEQIAGVAFQQMKSLDQQGRNPFGESTGNDPSVKEAVTSEIKNKSLLPDMTVDIASIKVTADNSKEAKMRYARQIEAIAAEHPSKKEYKKTMTSIQDDIKRTCIAGDSGINKELAEYYKTLTMAYADVTVPVEWAEMHRTVVQHFKTGEVIFGAITNCLDDPLKTFAAAKLFPQFATEATEMKKTFETMYNGIQ